MRLFIALDLPPAVRAELNAAQERLRRSERLMVRWTPAEAMHLTLQFLGETSAALVAPLLAGLAALPTVPFELQLAALGVFPDARRPRVLWAGIGGDLAALGEIQRAVQRITAPLGFAAEARPFHPHLTLARLRTAARPAESAALAKAFAAATPPAALAWPAAQPLLYRSTLNASGARYTVLGPSATH